MSDEKKDLTRIEDLGEYLHELSQEDEASSFENSEIPDLPTEETDLSEINFGSEDNSFESSEDSPDFGGSEEITFTSDDSTLEEVSEDLSFTSEDSTFTDDNTFQSSEEESSETDEAPFTIEDESPLFGETDSTSESELPTLELSELEPEPIADSFDPIPEPIAEPGPEPVQATTPEPLYKAPENFADLKKFAENSSMSGMGVEGNPSFSVLLKNVQYIEDVNDIVTMLKELNLLNDGEEQIRGRLMRGQLLVPRISEFAAIFLAHKLRRFDIDIQVGLSDEIHPPKHEELPETGMVSKYSLYQNQTHHFNFDDQKLELSQIIVAATPNLEGHQVIRYLGIASEHKMLEGHIVEDEISSEIPHHYTELAQKLKAHALKSHANAVIGLNYQLTPLPSEYGLAGTKYRLSCTGNLVWVNKL